MCDAHTAEWLYGRAQEQVASEMADEGRNPLLYQREWSERTAELWAYWLDQDEDGEVDHADDQS